MAGTGLPAAMLWVVGAAPVVSAIPITGFCDGAIATQPPVGDVAAPRQIVFLAVAILAWAGLYLRDPRLRALLR